MQPPGLAAVEQEKRELEAVLASGIFTRAPNLAHLLSYICGKHFEGADDQLKEYTIAVEALRRPAEFDPKQDSIVRVEAHRLRKRLREYYEADGAAHAVQIVVPSGQYAPKFVSRVTPAIDESLNGSLTVLNNIDRGSQDLVAAPPERGELSFRVHRPWWRTQIAWTAFCVILVVALAFIAVRRDVARTSSADSTLPFQSDDDIRILAGTENGTYTDAFGRLWNSDQFFTGGTVFRPADHRIVGTRDPRLYQSRREGAFQYDIPLRPGVYELRLHFAETLYGEANLAGGGETSRLFNVLLNGQSALQEFDVVADGGASAADVKVFKSVSPAGDGKLHLSFEPVNNRAFVNAIEITSGIQGRLRPIRLVARDRGYTDKSGRYWQPDGYSRSGLLVARTDPVAGAEDPELYRGERFGNFSYVIPVPPGRYGVRFYLAETWFGPKKPAGGGDDSRRFDILCNGIALVRDFNIFKEAGGSDRAVVKEFHGLTPNHQDKLVFSFIPAKNYACINAIEILDESK
jgi:Malectin domain